MCNEGNEIALRQVCALDLVVQLCIGNGNRSMITQTVKECKVFLGVARALKQEQANDLSLTANGDDDLRMRCRQYSFRAIAIANKRYLMRLSAFDRGSNCRQFERHERIRTIRQNIIIALLRH